METKREYAESPKKSLKMIPNVLLDGKALCSKAETEGLYLIDSNLKACWYVLDDNQVLFFSASEGYIKMTKDRFKRFAKEIQEISEVYL